MTSPAEFIPICDHCPMQEAGDASQQEMSNAREAAVDITYNQRTEPWDVSDKLEQRGFNPELASFATECIGQIQRRYCWKADRDWRDDGTAYVVNRTDLELDQF